MDVCLAELLRVRDHESSSRRREFAGVADLAAAFGIKRRDVEDDLALLTRLQFGDRVLATEHRDDTALAGLALVADESSLAVDAQVAPQVDVELAGGTRHRALRIHRSLEPGLVDREAAFARDVVGEVDREAVRVVETEHCLARNFLLAAERADGGVEQGHALRQRFGETLLFLQDDFLDVRTLCNQLGIGGAHFLLERPHERVEERLALAEHETMANRTTHDPAQHVAAAFVRRQHAVCNQERRGAHMVRDHAQRVRREIAGSRGLRRCRDQIPEQVDLVIAVHALHDGGDTLEAHARVHRWLRQRRQRAVGRAVELHEHEVPDLDVAIAVLVGRTRRAAGTSGPWS